MGGVSFGWDLAMFSLYTVRICFKVKLDKVFAKPFLFALDGHMDGIWSMETLRSSLSTLISGSCDGEVRVWDLAERKCLWSTKAHDG